MKLEMHCHSLGSSFCADCPYVPFIQKFIDNGYDGMVITNHFSKGHFDEYDVQGDYNAKVTRFFEYFDEYKKLATENGLKVFMGAEVRLSCNGTEYNLLGFDRDFMFDRVVYALTQEELFNLCNEKGVLLYQTHPYRVGVKPTDPRFMHGAEVFNGHVGHDNGNEKAKKFCEDNNLIKLVGTDLHHQNQPLTTAMIFRDNICDEKQLVKAIFSGEYQIEIDFEKVNNL